jgi:Leucine-rich repeat (LRR) protein
MMCDVFCRAGTCRWQHLLVAALDHLQLSQPSAASSAVERHMCSTDYSQLQVLILGSHKLPQRLDQLQQLVHLDLQGNQLSKVPDQLFNLKKLKYLSLRSCAQLTVVPDALGSLTSLQRLHLENCEKLQQLPTTVGELYQLSTLALDHCSMLKALPDVFEKLMGLQSLSLLGCSKLKLLPESLGQLVKQHAKQSGGAPQSTPEYCQQCQHMALRSPACSRYTARYADHTADAGTK